SFLGSTYKVLPQESEHVRMVTLDQIDRSLNAKFAMNKSQACYELRIEVIEGVLSWQAETSRIVIVPSGSFEKPSTLRWCYRIAWLSCQE
ncbi:MAG: hypothetical protein ACK6B2_07665, partial [Planctomycetota bacterium]